LLHQLVTTAVRHLTGQGAAWPKDLFEWTEISGQLAFLQALTMYQTGDDTAARFIVHRVVAHLSQDFLLTNRPSERLVQDIGSRCIAALPWLEMTMNMALQFESDGVDRADVAFKAAG